MAAFAFTPDELLYGGWTADCGSFPVRFPPGSQSYDLEPENVILLHPQVLESMVRTPGR